MEKVVRKFGSPAEAERADRGYYRSLTPEQRIEIFFELVRRVHGDLLARLGSIYRVVKRKRG